MAQEKDAMWPEQVGQKELKDDGGPAFPDPAPSEDGKPGMTLRDYFAVHAMTALMSLESLWLAMGVNQELGSDNDAVREKFAMLAYKQADAMLKARAE